MTVKNNPEATPSFTLVLISRVIIAAFIAALFVIGGAFGHVVMHLVTIGWNLLG